MSNSISFVGKKVIHSLDNKECTKERISSNCDNHDIATAVAVMPTAALSDAVVKLTHPRTCVDDRFGEELLDE